MQRMICILASMLPLAPAWSADSSPAILIFGDSISAAYGIRVEQGWVRLLENQLKSEGYAGQVINASVSGETTSGGLARLPRALSIHKPEIVVLELGGNDGLRALPISQVRANLRQMIVLAKAAQARVLLVGMRMPPNYGAQYTSSFYSVFEDLSREQHVPLVPFLLDEVALHTDLMQADGIHPNVSGQAKLLANVWPQLSGMLIRH